MWSLNCLTIWITHSNPCCLSNHSFPNYSVAIHKQSPKIISRIRNLLHSSVNDKTQKNQRSPTHNNRLSSAGICTKYSAQYSAIFSTIFCAQYSADFCAQYSAPSFIISSSPVCSLPSCSNQQWQLHLFHHAVTRIKPAWMRKSEEKKTSSPVSAADVGDHSAAAVLLLPPKEAAAASAVRRVNSGSSVNS